MGLPRPAGFLKTASFWLYESGFERWVTTGVTSFRRPSSVLDVAELEEVFEDGSGFVLVGHVDRRRNLFDQMYK